MKKALTVFLSLALVFSCFAVLAFSAAAEDDVLTATSEESITVVSATFASSTAGECKESIRGGAADNSVLYDGATLADTTITSFDTKGIVLTQNTRCTEAGVYPEYSYTLELSGEADITAVKIATFEYYMAMIGLPKDNNVAIEYSEDGTDFVLAGDYQFEGEAVNGEIAANEYTIDLGKTVTGKYVKLTFAYGDSPFADKVVWEWHGFTELGVVATPAGQTVDVGDDPEAYLWLKGVYTNDSDDTNDIQPSITFIIDASTLTKGEQYTVYCHARFDEGSTGTVYVNEYAYSDTDAAKAADWTYLLNFKDFALCGEATLGQWQDFTFSWDPSQNDRGATGDTCAAITMGIGFWQASGGIAVSEYGIKDASGNVVWSYNFKDGLDVTDEALVAYNFPGDEDGNWGLVGAEITDGTEIPDESSEESEPVTPPTGDTGIIALAIISAISLAGAVVIKKR